MDATPKKRRGRPAKGSAEVKSIMLQVRINESEKATFEDAARLSGIGVSTWVRERLRSIARKELDSAGLPITFLNSEKKQEE